MAEKPGPDETSLELRRKIVRSRELVVRDMSGMRYELDFPLRVRRAIQRNTVVWVGAALAIGLGLALLRARPRTIYVGGGGKKMDAANKTLLGSGLVLAVLKMGMTLVQPMVVGYLAKMVAKKTAAQSRPSRNW